jgi:integration host factor subunit beta
MKNIDRSAEAMTTIKALKVADGTSKTEAESVVTLFFNGMADALARGDRVEIHGFCSFFVKDYESYTSRNPKTGERVPTAPKKLPFFKAGKGLEERADNYNSN